MCLTLTNATTILDHHPSHRPTGRGYTRTLHPAAELTPGDLWPDPDLAPHTVTEVHHTRDRKGPQHWITLVDQYAQPHCYRSDELVLTAVPDPHHFSYRQGGHPMIASPTPPAMALPLGSFRCRGMSQV